MQVLEGHKGHVYSLAYAPDGLTLASGDAYNVILLWDLATSAERARFKVNRPKHRIPGVHGLAFHPGGGALAAAGGGPEPTVFDLSTGKPSRGLAGHESPVFFAAYTGDGTLVSAGRADYGTTDAVLWEGDPPRLRSRLVFGYEAIRSFAVARDVDSVAIGVHHGGMLWAPRLSPPGDSYPAQFRRLSARTGEVTPSVIGEDSYLREVPHPANHEMTAVALSPDGRLLATTHWTTVRLLDARELRLLAVLEGHDQPVQSLAFSPDGRTLASGGQDGTLRLWDVAGREERSCLDAEDGWVNALAFSPDGMTVAAGCEEDIFLWDVGGDAW